MNEQPRPEEILQETSAEIYAEKYADQPFAQKFNVSKGANIHNDPVYKVKVVESLKKVFELENLPKEKFSDRKNKETIEKVSAAIQASANKAVVANEATSFSHTNQERTFFGTAKRVDDVPYSHSMFNIGLQGPEATEYLKMKLEDKVIYLLGGGNSAMDLIQSEDIHPRQVINIDPFITKEPINKNKKENYLSLDVRADDPSLPEKISEKQLPKAQEIWASYSVPYYLETPTQISALFANIKSLLDENGTARITPLCIQNIDDGSSQFETTKNELVTQIKEMLDSKDFNVYYVDRTLIIEKLPQTKA